MSTAAASRVLRWSFYTDSPLAGLSLARETRQLLVWDTSHVCYLLDADGQLVSRHASREPLAACAISDNGQRIVLATGERRLLWCDVDFKTLATRRTPAEPVSIAVDAHGRLAAVGTTGLNLLADCYGRKLVEFESHRQLSCAKFLLELPVLLGSSESGWLAAFDLDGEMLWKNDVGSKLGPLAATSDGAMIIVPAFHSGVLRLRADGNDEGVYRLDELPHCGDVSVNGQRLWLGTRRQQLILLAGSGKIEWTHRAETPIVDVAIDALGRRGWFGLESGCVGVFELDKAADGTQQVAAVGESSLRAPDWTLPLEMPRLEHAELVILDASRRIGMFAADKRLTIFTPPQGQQAGGPIHTSDPLPGRGRIIRQRADRLIAVSERHLLRYEVGNNRSQVLDPRFAELTHCELLGDDLVIIEERDRLARSSLAGEIRWRHTLSESAEQLAVHDNAIVVLTDRGQLQVFSPDGSRRQVPPLPEDQPRRLAVCGDQLFLAGLRDYTLAASNLDGTLLWQRLLPVEPWQMFAVGGFVVVRSPDGETTAVDRRGGMATGAQPVVSAAWYFALPDGRLARVFFTSGSLSCADFAGRSLWRHLETGEGPVAAGSAGVAALLNGRLCWFCGSGRIVGH